jgi:hypothetical protein
VLSTAVVLLWQALVVHFDYHGNWTALFCTGARFEQPPALAVENIYRFENSSGFDGQFYHYIAHDPFFLHGLARYVDLPRLRYRRILVPLMTYGVALGRSGLIDSAYITVVLVFVWLGSYWLSAFLSLHGLPPGWGALFALIPGVLVSIDRLTVDIALVALSLALALYFARGAQLPLYLTLVMAPLVRETGLLLVVAQVAYLILGRRWRMAFLFSTAVLPAAGWYVFVALHTAPIHESRWFTTVPLAALVRRVLEPVTYQLPPLAAFVATALDYVALTGMIFAIGISYSMVWRLKGGPVEISLLLFGLLASFLAGRHGWGYAYDFGRSLAPLPLFAALYGLEKRKWVYALPLALVVPRVALQLAPHGLAVIRGLVGLGHTESLRVGNR